MKDLKNRVALVTGGSRGIGAAVTIALARAGADIAVNYRDRADAANAVVDCRRMRFDVVVACQVEGLAHRPNVSISKQWANVGLIARQSRHGSHLLKPSYNVLAAPIPERRAEHRGGPL